MKLRKSVKEKWLKALRSGKYKQTTSVLKDDVGYCCLGVLCDIHRITVKQKGMRFDKFGNYNLTSGNLPKVVAEWAGLDTKDKRFASGCIEILEDTYLTELNDHGASFKEIAKIIQKNL